ncbi:hypothetical protein AAHA92_06247 [Salvia divinorum]|uniref:Myb/SANT-like domain-containing protein n=1 Tax=Salvia divinorum TaxID=28513 RepID=A0ABD1I524_SALDI
MNIPPQEMFLYKGKWTLKIETILVDTIIRLKEETGWVLKEFPSYFMLTAGKEIESMTAVLFTVEEVAVRVEMLLLRYPTFKKLVTQDGVHWDLPTKCVIAAECVWKKICKKNAFA